MPISYLVIFTTSYISNSYYNRCTLLTTACVYQRQKCENKVEEEEKGRRRAGKEIGRTNEGGQKCEN